MTGHIKGEGRHQATLITEVLDDFIDENNPVRVIDNNQSNVNIELMNTKLQWLKQKLIELQDIQVTLEQLSDKQLSRTDPDSRLMKTNHMNRQVCYNVQTAVDTKHHFIVAH